MKLRHTLKYGDWLIKNDTSYQSVYTFEHKDYDGDSSDKRHGLALSVELAIEEIDLIETADDMPAMLREQA